MAGLLGQILQPAPQNGLLALAMNLAQQGGKGAPTMAGLANAVQGTQQQIAAGQDRERALEIQQLQMDKYRRDAAADQMRQTAIENLTDEELRQYAAILGPEGVAQVLAAKMKSKYDVGSVPSDISEYQYAVGQGYKGTFQQYQLEMKRAGAMSVNLGNSTVPSPGITGETLYAQLPSGVKAPTGFGFTASGELRPLPGGPDDPKNSVGATMDERKAAYLLARLQNAEKIMSDPALEAYERPEILPAIVGAIGPEAAANSLRSDGRQQYEAAMVDAVDAALTLGTGAAYTKEQIEAARKSHIPQIGDGPDVIAQKAESRRALIEAARVSAGRAGSLVPPLLERPKPTETKKYREGATATGPGGEKRVYTNGQWVPL